MFGWCWVLIMVFQEMDVLSDTQKKWDFWISGSYNHEEPGSTESITAGIEGGYQRSGVDHSSFYEAEGR